jgi:hypothetical protein
MLNLLKVFQYKNAGSVTKIEREQPKQESELLVGEESKI